MTDFDNWYKYIVEHTGPIERERAIEIYKEFYNCDCIACEYRKEHGLMPVNLGSGCKLPMSLEAIEKVLNDG